MDAMNRTIEGLDLVELGQEATGVVGGGLSTSPLGLIIVVCTRPLPFGGQDLGLTNNEN